MPDPHPNTKTEPWKHQIKAWELSQSFNAYYYALDMATGKSKCAIDYCSGKNLGNILIVCPKSVISVWPDQFETHSFSNWATLPLDKWTTKKKADEIDKHIKTATARNKKSAVILNYESFWRSPLGPTYNRKHRITDIGILAKLKFDGIILDEAHRIKSPSGRASWGATKIAKQIKHRLLLSGTPMPHSPTDIYAQYRAMEPSIYGTSFHRFKMKYCVMGGYENRQVVKFINMEDFNQRFYSRAFRVMADDVLDLPIAMHEVRKCELPQKVIGIYKELEKEFIAQLDSGEITVDNALVKLLRLSQLTGGYVQLDDGSHEIIDSSKIEVLRDLVTDLPVNEPIVIFCRFTSEIKRVREVCEKQGRTTAELSGNVNMLEAWKTGKMNTLVVQIRTGGIGVNLTRAHYCIYFSTGYSLGDYEQSLARIRRPEQKHHITYYHIIAKGTVDEGISKSLRQKKNVVENVLMKLGNSGISGQVIETLSRLIEEKRIVESIEL